MTLAALGNMRQLYPFLVLFAVACSQTPDSGESDEDLRNRHSVIEYKASNNRAVVLLVDANGEAFCHGTLVRKDVVLTSASCASRQPTTVFFGKVRRGNESTEKIAETKRHPGWYKESEAEFGCQLSASRDVALLRLAAPIAAAVPAPIAYEDVRVRFERTGVFVAYALLDSPKDSPSVMELRERPIETNAEPDDKIKTSFEFWGDRQLHHDGAAFISEGRVFGIQACTVRVGKTLGRFGVSPHLSNVANFIDSTLADWKRTNLDDGP
jgi:Trypsin